MARFVDITKWFRNIYVNTDHIKKIGYEKGTGLLIELIDGSKEIVPPADTWDVLERLRGRKHITQILPVQEPTYAVYDYRVADDSDAAPSDYYAVPIHYLLLCADGSVHPAWLCSGMFDFADEGSLYIGLYKWDRLADFPGIKVIREDDRDGRK